MKVSLPSVDYEYAFLCDDVRQEHNNKLIMIGVYGNNLLLEDFPRAIRLRLVTRIHPKQQEFAFNTRVNVNGAPFVIIKGQVGSSTLEPELTATPEFVVKIDAPGTLSFDVNDNDFDLENADKVDWTPLFSIPVGKLG
jgi:hypothetical protein